MVQRIPCDYLSVTNGPSTWEPDFPQYWELIHCTNTHALILACFFFSVQVPGSSIRSRNVLTCASIRPLQKDTSLWNTHAAITRLSATSLRAPGLLDLFYCRWTISPSLRSCSLETLGHLFPGLPNAWHLSVLSGRCWFSINSSDTRDALCFPSPWVLHFSQILFSFLLFLLPSSTDWHPTHSPHRYVFHKCALTDINCSETFILYRWLWHTWHPHLKKLLLSDTFPSRLVIPPCTAATQLLSMFSVFFKVLWSWIYYDMCLYVSRNIYRLASIKNYTLCLQCCSSTHGPRACQQAFCYQNISGTLHPAFYIIIFDDSPSLHK